MMRSLLIHHNTRRRNPARVNTQVASTLGALSLLSDIAAAKRQGDRAVAFSAVLETLNPRDGEAVFLHAQRLGQVGRWADALSRLRDLRESNPDHGAIANTLGVALYNTNAFERAKDEFEHAVRIAPNNTDYKANLDAVNEALFGATTDVGDALRDRVSSPTSSSSSSSSSAAAVGVSAS